MRIGIGLPNAVKGATGAQILDFARRADETGFSSLGTIDRIVYDNHEPLVTLGGAAAVTERIGLATTILIGPYRINTALLAKQAATVQSLSSGRFTLGIAVGAREDDFEASGASMEGRGTRLDHQLEELKRIWAGEERGHEGAIGPMVDPPPIVVGGTVPASFRRAAKYGEGWISGGAPPDQFAQMADAARAAWRDAGREGEPLLTSLAYFSLGPDAEQNASESFGSYYAWLGEELAAMLVGSVATSAEMVQQYVSAFEGAGCDELILFPGSADPEQVDLLAEAAGVQGGA